jgi:heme A synthase
VNTFLLLAALAITAWRLSGAPGNRWRKQGTDGTIVAVMLGMTLLVGLTGAITSLGDTLYPATSLAAGMRDDFAATSHFITRLRVVHPALALLTALVASLSAAALARRRPSPDTTGMARIARTLIVVQIIGGFANLALLAPVWMQLVHLMLADFTWLSLVLLSATALAQQPKPNNR